MVTKQVNNRLAEARVATYFPPGQSGNPAGRPKNSVTTLLKNTDELTNEQIAKKLIELALAGDLPALIHYIDRTDGKVADKLQMTGTMLVATPDQLDLAMRLMLENKANETRLLAESIDSDRSQP